MLFHFKNEFLNTVLADEDHGYKVGQTIHVKKNGWTEPKKATIKKVKGNKISVDYHNHKDNNYVLPHHVVKVEDKTTSPSTPKSPSKPSSSPSSSSLPTWFKAKSKEGQAEYIKNHPNSKIAKHFNSTTTTTKVAESKPVVPKKAFKPKYDKSLDEHRQEEEHSPSSLVDRSRIYPEEYNKTEKQQEKEEPNLKQFPEWWGKYSKKWQENYVKTHPKSKIAKLYNASKQPTHGPVKLTEIPEKEPEIKTEPSKHDFKEGDAVHILYSNGNKSKIKYSIDSIKNGEAHLVGEHGGAFNVSLDKIAKSEGGSSEPKTKEKETPKHDLKDGDEVHFSAAPGQHSTNTYTLKDVDREKGTATLTKNGATLSKHVPLNKLIKPENFPGNEEKKEEPKTEAPDEKKQEKEEPNLKPKVDGEFNEGDKVKFKGNFINEYTVIKVHDKTVDIRNKYGKEYNTAKWKLMHVGETKPASESPSVEEKKAESPVVPMDAGKSIVNTESEKTEEKEDPTEYKIGTKVHIINQNGTLSANTYTIEDINENGIATLQGSWGNTYKVYMHDVHKVGVPYKEESPKPENNSFSGKTEFKPGQTVHIKYADGELSEQPYTIENIDSEGKATLKSPLGNTLYKPLHKLAPASTDTKREGFKVGDTVNFTKPSGVLDTKPYKIKDKDDHTVSLQANDGSIVKTTMNSLVAPKAPGGSTKEGPFKVGDKVVNHLGNHHLIYTVTAVYGKKIKVNNSSKYYYASAFKHAEGYADANNTPEAKKTSAKGNKKFMVGDKVQFTNGSGQIYTVYKVHGTKIKLSHYGQYLSQDKFKLADEQETTSPNNNSNFKPVKLDTSNPVAPSSTKEEPKKTDDKIVVDEASKPKDPDKPEPGDLVWNTWHKTVSTYKGMKDGKPVVEYDGKEFTNKLDELKAVPKVVSHNLKKDDWVKVKEGSPVSAVAGHPVQITKIQPDGQSVKVLFKDNEIEVPISELVGTSKPVVSTYKSNSYSPSQYDNSIKDTIELTPKSANTTSIPVGNFNTKYNLPGAKLKEGFSSYRIFCDTHYKDACVEKLTQQEKNAMDSYRSSPGVNSSLRYSNSVPDQAKMLDSAIDKMPGTKDTLTIWRGLKLKPEEQVIGGIHTDKGFMSASNSASISKGFGPHLVKIINLPVGTKMLPMYNGATGVTRGFDGNENEFLLPRDSSLRVTDIQYINGHKVWIVEYIAPEKEIS